MAKELPKAYFPGCIAKIYLRTVDRWAESMKKHFPYFDTWQEAHHHMLDDATKKVKRLERDLASAKRHLAKVEAMKEDA